VRLESRIPLVNAILGSSQPKPVGVLYPHKDEP
jgi:hypothetical protein